MEEILHSGFASVQDDNRRGWVYPTIWFREVHLISQLR